MTFLADLRSDTVTRPTAAMRQAMIDAEVGDDVFGDDPTVSRLESVMAERLGKEAGLFVPSGTMSNQLAIRCWTRPGERVLMEASAHIYYYEGGGPAVISGVMCGLVPGFRGVMSPEDAEAAIPPGDDIHQAPATLLAVENTANRGGGTAYPQATLDDLAAMAHRRGLATHMDGARVFNAQAVTGVSATRIAQGWDSVSVCLSKGLGAPVGSVLVGPRDFIARALRFRKMLGGGMRQVGILAAAGLYALEHHVDRLAEDHARARHLHARLAAMGIDGDPPASNMVYIRIPNARNVEERLASEGIGTIALDPGRLRMVTHLDVDDAGIEATVEAFRRVVEG